MTMRDIFVPIFSQIDCGGQLDFAADLAPRLGANVNVVFTRPTSTLATATVPDMLITAGVTLETSEQEERAATNPAHAQFEAWRTANGLSGNVGLDEMSGCVATWHERIGTVEASIVDIGRLSDLIVIGQIDPYEVITDEAFTAAIYATGRPVLITPDRISGDPLDHVIIAWNGSLQAARAVAATMPLLRLAQRVTVFSVPPCTDLLRHELGLIPHLARHGVHAEYVTSEDTGDVGFQLLTTARMSNTTMIVMGAYAHNRVREALVGGVTRHVLKRAQIPVVMMH
jgi:nucleotide-binding universal stress UspA family protein